MRRAVILSAALPVFLSGCGAGASTDSEPSPSASPAAGDLDRLDRLWSEVATTRAELGLEETRLIIDCLEEQRFTVHDVQELTMDWSFAGPPPSASLEAAGDPLDLPAPEEAETRALGIWLRFVRSYDDQAGIELQEAERESGERDGEEAALDELTPPAELAELEPLGEGWEQLPAIEQMRWEIAYRGTAWAMTSKAASIMSGDDWAELGIPDGEWRQRSDVSEPPEGCKGEVLSDLYGEPQLLEHDFGHQQWVWGPTLGGSAIPMSWSDLTVLPESEQFFTCVEAAGYTEWGRSDIGGLDYGDYWDDRYRFPGECSGL
ncbi:hypothetical protein GCM10027447_05000 [Glycomyces halotolerans]